MIKVKTWITDVEGNEIDCVARLMEYSPPEPEVGLPDLVEYELLDPHQAFTPDQLWRMASYEDLKRIEVELLEEREQWLRDLMEP